MQRVQESDGHFTDHDSLRCEAAVSGAYVHANCSAVKSGEVIKCESIIKAHNI